MTTRGRDSHASARKRTTLLRRSDERILTLRELNHALLERTRRPFVTRRAADRHLQAQRPPSPYQALCSYDLPRAPLPPAETPVPARFLPKCDSALLAYSPPERGAF